MIYKIIRFGTNLSKIFRNRFLNGFLEKKNDKKRSAVKVQSIEFRRALYAVLETIDQISFQ